MNDFNNKTKDLKKSKIEKDWNKIKSGTGLSTKEKLEKLVKQNIREKSSEVTPPSSREMVSEDLVSGFIVREYSYPVDEAFGKVTLKEWDTVEPDLLSVLFNYPEISGIDPGNFLYFDTETTGLSGGTGTIPFMLGFGFFDEQVFRVKIFVLNDLNAEEEFLDEVDNFLNGNHFSATVTYNGKSFDFPLMETRYILNRKRFPLLKLPHLDFLQPARILWKNTYESRKLGFLGDILLNISRDDDIPGSLIPSLYFNYLRSGNFSLIENVIEHNAMDIVGLSALMLLGVKYLQDVSNTDDEGEILGVAQLYERSGELLKAEELYEFLKEKGSRGDIIFKAVKRLALIKKKSRLMNEAVDLWRTIEDSGDHFVLRELSIYFEHREKNFYKAVNIVQKGLELAEITEKQRKELNKRLIRLKQKIEKTDE